MSYSSRHIIHSEVFQLDGMSATTAGTMARSFISCLIPAKTPVNLHADRKLTINKSPMNPQWYPHAIFYIPNRCFDAYELKVNKDTFKHQVKTDLSIPKIDFKSLKSCS